MVEWLPSLSAEVQSQDNTITRHGTYLAVAMADVVTSESPATSSSAMPFPSEGSEKPPFGCGCGKCTFFSFIERGCPTPFSPANSFPYLNINGLTHEQQEVLRERLRFESEKMMMRFQELLSATVKSLIKQSISHDELVIHVMALGAFKPVFKKPQVPAFHHCFQELQCADNVPKVFLVLKDYFSFFNYHILEHIIKELGTEQDKANLQSYRDDFNQYAKRRIFQCLSEFGPENGVCHADIFVKLDTQYDDYTVAEIKGFCHKLSEILNISSQGILRLCRVEKGCFQLKFQVPSFVRQEIFPLYREQERILATEGVIKLTCGDYQFDASGKLGNMVGEA